VIRASKHLHFLNKLDMSVIGTSATMCRMTLRSATRSGEPERACESFSHGNRAPNPTDSSTRQVRLEEVNRALAHEETGGLDNIYEMPEPRSMTSRSATRTGSPLTSLLAKKHTRAGDMTS